MESGGCTHQVVVVCKEHHSQGEEEQRECHHLGVEEELMSPSQVVVGDLMTYLSLGEKKANMPQLGVEGHSWGIWEAAEEWHQGVKLLCHPLMWET